MLTYFVFDHNCNALQNRLMVANLLGKIPRQIPLEIVNFSWNTPKMISHGRKSEEKCYVEELARFALVTKEFCIVDRI